MVRATPITAKVAAKVLEVVDAGLTSGLGGPNPGNMCVEAAVCYAMGWDHGDHPKCVTDDLISCKIGINDHFIWGTHNPGFHHNDESIKKLRASALRRLAIAQLGSKGKISNEQWQKALEAYCSTRSPTYKKYLKDRAEAVKVSEAELNSIMFQCKEALKAVKAGKPYEFTYPSLEDIDEPEEFDWDVDVLTLLEVDTVAKAKRVCEDLVQILIKLKSPGTKFLYLTEKAKKSKAKKVTKKRAAKHK